jgi:hypothetical protein
MLYYQEDAMLIALLISRCKPNLSSANMRETLITTLAPNVLGPCF